MPARVAPSVVQAEDGTLSGDASAVTPASLWTGESQFGGTGYASLRRRQHRDLRPRRAPGARC